MASIHSFLYYRNSLAAFLYCLPDREIVSRLELLEMKRGCNLCLLTTEYNLF